MWAAMKFNIQGDSVAHRRWRCAPTLLCATPISGIACRVMRLAREYNYDGKISSPLPTLSFTNEVRSHPSPASSHALRSTAALAARSRCSRPRTSSRTTAS